MTNDKLQNIVNEILSNANPRDFNELVNWGNLQCVDVNQEIRIYVKDAAPGTHDLGQYIIRELEKLGLNSDHISVHFDW